MTQHNLQKGDRVVIVGSHGGFSKRHRGREAIVRFRSADTGAVVLVSITTQGREHGSCGWVRTIDLRRISPLIQLARALES